MQKKNFPKKNISRLIQRANDIVVACRRDKHELTGLGLSWEKVQELAELAPVCSDIDIQYRLQKETNALATSELKDVIKKCIALRTRLAEDIRTAFGIAEVHYVLKGTWKNKTQTALVQDLNDLAVLARIYRSELERVNFDFTLAHHAACESKELSMLIATVTLDREMVTTTEQTNRYEMLISLYNKMKVICTYGRRAFAKDPVRRFAYRAIE
jgi:hypothetical protein